MLSLYRHQRIETLAEELGARLSDELRERDAFYQPTIAVGSRAMERFISEYLAARFGVASNLRFLRPAELLHRLVEARLGGSIDGLRAWDPSSLRFAVLGELPQLMELEEASFLRSYLGERTEAHERRSLLLATELADILDRLIHYRPEETRALRAGVIPAAFEADPAARLFQRLLSLLETRLGESHLLALLDRLSRAEPQKEQKEQIGPLHLFGLSYLPPLHLQLLSGFAATRSIHAYLISPFEHFIERDYFRYAERDELSAIFHPLLAAWGSLGTDFLHRLFEGAEGADDHLLPPEPEPDHLLGRLRDDLRKVREPSLYEGENWNIEIHSTFGMLRQVEALRERLLHLFSNDPGLRPRDIAILTPDPDRFGPLIEAVFGQSEPGIPSIPITLTDSSLASLSEASSLLFQLFELATVRVTLPGIAALFELRGLSSKFGIPEDQQGELREILAMSMMRCHIDELDPAADPDVPLSGAHTIQAGLRRILLGSLMRDPEESSEIGLKSGGEKNPEKNPEESSLEAEIVRGYLPLTGLGAERLELVHQLIEAMDAILGLIPELRRARPLDGWLDLVARVFETLLPPLDLGAEGVLYQLGQLRLEYEASQPKEPPDTHEPLIFSASAFAYELERRLDESSDRPVGRRGGIVVSRLTPMRALPFRIIALLGLDEERFPRRARHHALDLVAKKSRPGDRLAGREDRHLLFEALLAARDRLMIFYTGRDATTNEAIPPAVPVAELLDVLRAMNTDPKRELILEHPLHPFSPRLFVPETPPLIRVHSESGYLGANALAARRSADTKAESYNADERIRVDGIYASAEGERALVEIELDELIRFFANPARMIARRALRVALPEESLRLEDREPLEAEALSQYQLRSEMLDELLASGLDSASIASARARLDRLRSARGDALPHGLDEPLLAKAEELARRYLEALREDSAPPLRRITLEGSRFVSGKDALFLVSPTVRYAAGDEIILATASSNASRAKLEAWLLLALTDGATRRARILHRAQESVKIIPLTLYAPPPTEQLIAWLRVYLGLDNDRFPMPLGPAFDVAKALLNGDGEAAAMARGDSAYHAVNFAGGLPEAARPENIAVYRGSPFDESSPFYSRGLALIETLYIPMLRAFEESGSE